MHVRCRAAAKSARTELQSVFLSPSTHPPTHSYSRQASPPPSSASVALRTGVMGGWSPTSTPPACPGVIPSHECWYGFAGIIFW